MKIQSQTLVSIPVGDHEYHLLDVQLPEGIPLFRDETGRICVLSRACSLLAGYKQKDTIYRLMSQKKVPRSVETSPPPADPQGGSNGSGSHAAPAMKRPIQLAWGSSVQTPVGS